jgi:hypothetical protein
LDTVSALAALNPASKSKPTASTAHRQDEDGRAKKFLAVVMPLDAVRASVPLPSPVVSS